MSRRRQIYEGKAKILYEGPEPGTLIQYFKDDAAEGAEQFRVGLRLLLPEAVERALER